VTSLDGAGLYMDATITPNRSMGEGGRKAVMIGLCIGCSFISVFLFAIGAWPAPFFLGLDVAAIWWAFRVQARNAERCERVRVSAEAVIVSREEKTVWTSPTAFTGVAVDRPGEHDTRVRLTLSGKRLTVGAALSPEERWAFAQALRLAIANARAERYPA
jgi:uncharacterized membrane protein